MGFGWVTLTTDYGRTDGFVAACHGVIARIAPTVRIIDVTHDVPPQNVRHAAVVLAQTVAFLPAAVHVAVVDPGVGTTRRGVGVQTAGGVFVGPDNGVLLWAAGALGEVQQAVELRNPALRLSTGARTFDGRDVFAPAAAHVARGVPLHEFGPAVDLADLVRLPAPRRVVRDGSIETEVLAIDHFGNVQLAALGDDLVAAGLSVGVQLHLRGHSVPIRAGATFAEVAAGEPVIFTDSAGHLAIAVNHGNAARVFHAEPGDPVTLTA